jgi:uncharacterized membrane protein (UPF0182 family)
MFRSGLTGKEEFVILRPFVPFSTNDRRTELESYLTASSDPETYGELVSYVVDQDPLPPGPLRVADQAESEQDISPRLSLQSNAETRTRVVFGDLQLVPVSDGLLYVRPVYVVSSDVTEFRFVIVSTGNNAVIDTDLEGAINQLFPGFEGVIGDRVQDANDGGQSPTGGEPSDTSSTDESSTGSSSDQSSSESSSNSSPTGSGGTVSESDALELLSEAQVLFQQADELLRNGDLGGYQQTVELAQQKVTEAIDALDN